MTQPTIDWERRNDELWSAIDDLEADDFRARIQALADELPAGSAVGLFEVGAAHDTTGQGELAEPLYRRALAAGLSGYRRRRAVVQLASTLRNLGQAEESVALLTAEQEIDPHTLDEATRGLGDAVSAFLALALVDVGREREAVALSLNALSPHLPRYNRSLRNYANALVDPEA